MHRNALDLWVGVLVQSQSMRLCVEGDPKLSHIPLAGSFATLTMTTGMTGELGLSRLMHILTHLEYVSGSEFFSWGRRASTRFFFAPLFDSLRLPVTMSLATMSAIRSRRGADAFSCALAISLAPSLSGTHCC